MKENKINEDIEFSEDRLKDITKLTNKLIKELINEKMIIAIGNNKYKINMQKVYCKMCYKKELEKEKTEYNHNASDFIHNYYFYVWEVTRHLENDHYMNRKPYEWDEDKSIKNPITSEILKEYISESIPNYEVKSHDFEIVKTEYVREDRFDIKLKCKTCGYEHNCYENVSTCIREITN